MTLNPNPDGKSTSFGALISLFSTDSVTWVSTYWVNHANLYAPCVCDFRLLFGYQQNFASTIY